jgi:uncharacterized membrane protein YhiD involved in acid resistance
VALAYRFSVPGRVLSPAMQSSLVLLAMVAAMVMMVIGNNIARAFSLVGALAIVRFRTRLRSAWDISFVFFALAVGIGCGVMAYKVAVLGTVMVTLAVLALQVIPLGGIRSDRIHMLRCDVASFEGAEKEMEGVLDGFLQRRWLVEARSLRFGETLSLRYRVVVRDPDQIGEMLRQVGAVEGVERVIIDLGDEGPDREE